MQDQRRGLAGPFEPAIVSELPISRVRQTHVGLSEYRVPLGQLVNHNFTDQISGRGMRYTLSSDSPA
jgi:hypothetical protein